MKDLRCWAGFHKWHWTAWSSRAINLAHLSSMAGMRGYCERCGEQWDDIPPDYVQQEPP